MSLMDETTEGVKCEDLEKVIVDDDLEKKNSGRSPATSYGEGKADRVFQNEYLRVRMECSQNSWDGSELHLSSFECQSICHTQKATTSAFI